METQGGATAPKRSVETSERSKIVEEVFKRYHKNLIYWCIRKLNTKRFEHGMSSGDVESDSQEIVAYLYERLVKNETPIDLTRSEGEIRSFLNKALEQAIANFIRNQTASKRSPEGGLVSFEALLNDNGEENLPIKSKLTSGKYENEEVEKKEMQGKIEQAISMLASRNQKMADIIRKSYQEEKGDEEIAKEYGSFRQDIFKLRKKAEKIIRNIVNGKIKSALSIPKYESQQK